MKNKTAPNPWPTGSLCGTLVPLEISSSLVSQFGATKCMRHPSSSIKPGYFPILHIDSPVIYLGLGMYDSQYSYSAGNVEMVFFSPEFGLISWFPQYWYDYQNRSNDAFKQFASSVFKCVARFDKALG